MPLADPPSDQALLVAVATGDAAAREAFLARHADVLARICDAVTPNARAGAEAFRELSSVTDLGSLLVGFDGRATVRTFLVTVVTNRFLFPRMLARLDRDPVAAASDFEAFFRRDITRCVRTVVPRRDLDEDAVNWIWEQLLDDDGRQLRAFAREARTPGFVVVKLRRLAQDFLNSRAAPPEGRKRTLPEALAAAPAFDQDVFRQFYWRHAASADIALLALRQRHPDATADAVRAARARVEALLRAQGGALVVDRQTISIDAGRGDGEDEPKPGLQIAAPDAPSAFDEVEQAAFRKTVLAAARAFSNREKLCLLKRLQGKAAGEIARELGLPNAEAYELMRRVVDKLRKALLSHPAARERIATVTGNDAYLVHDRATGSGPARTKGADR